MTRRGLPQLLMLVALSGCANFWHPPLTNQPLPTLTDESVPAGQSLVEAATMATLAPLHADSMTSIVVIGPGPHDSIAVAAPPVAGVRRSFLRFTNVQLAPDSLAITMTYSYVCGGRCGNGGTVTLHRKPGRNWTVWTLSIDWIS